MIAEPEVKLLDPEALRLLDLYEKGQHAPLLNEVDELSKAGPLKAGVLGLAALSLSAMERHTDAVKAAKQALAQEPRWAWLYEALAAAEAGPGTPDALSRAMATQQRAVQLAPAEPAYGAALARYQRQAGNPSEAVATARKALQANPAHAGALNELGLALQASDDREGALQAFRQAQEAAPTDPDGYLHEGTLQSRAGDRGAACHALREALRRQPGMPTAEDRMAETISGPTGPARATLLHLLFIGRITLMGWLIIAFFYYLLFRLLEFIWKLWPAMLPVGRGLLLITLAYLLGGLALGRLLRLAFRMGWPL